MLKKYDYNRIDKGEFFKASCYRKLRKNLDPIQVVTALKELTGVDFTNVDKPAKQKLKLYKPFGYNCIKIRIMEDCLRVRDFSFFNSQIRITEDDKIVFEFTNLGEPRNHCIIADKTDIYFNTHGYLVLNVKGPVYYADGTRRYEGRRTDIY